MKVSKDGTKNSLSYASVRDAVAPQKRWDDRSRRGESGGLPASGVKEPDNRTMPCAHWSKRTERRKSKKLRTEISNVICERLQSGKMKGQWSLAAVEPR